MSNIDRLEAETTLWDIRLAARTIPSSRFNRYALAVIAITASMYSCLTTSSAGSLAQRARDLADLGFNFSAGILGFLLAGFTVFATITKEELFRTMAVHVRSDSGLTSLKHNLFSFMRVFFDYLCFASMCLLVKILGSAGGPISEIVGLSPDPDNSKSVIARVVFAVIVTMFAYIMLILKSFIYNVYRFVITTIRFSFLIRPPGPDDLDYDGE